MSEDQGLREMRAIRKAISPLDQEERRRVLRWLVWVWTNDFAEVTADNSVSR